MTALDQTREVDAILVRPCQLLPHGWDLGTFAPRSHAADVAVGKRTGRHSVGPRRALSAGLHEPGGGETR